MCDDDDEQPLDRTLSSGVRFSLSLSPSFSYNYIPSSVSRSTSFPLFKSLKSALSEIMWRTLGNFALLIAVCLAEGGRWGLDPGFPPIITIHFPQHHHCRTEAYCSVWIRLPCTILKMHFKEMSFVALTLVASPVPQSAVLEGVEKSFCPALPSSACLCQWGSPTCKEHPNAATQIVGGSCCQ